jgi:hypothetical protein
MEDMAACAHQNDQLPWSTQNIVKFVLSPSRSLKNRVEASTWSYPSGSWLILASLQYKWFRFISVILHDGQALVIVLVLNVSPTPQQETRANIPHYVSFGM